MGTYNIIINSLFFQLYGTKFRTYVLTYLCTYINIPASKNVIELELVHIFTVQLIDNLLKKVRVQTKCTDLKCLIETDA